MPEFFWPAQSTPPGSSPGRAHLLIQGLLPREVGLLRGRQRRILAGEGGHEILQKCNKPPMLRKETGSKINENVPVLEKSNANQLGGPLEGQGC